MFNIQFGIVIFTNMKIKTYTVLGVMSGTSLDGVDLAVVKFTKEEEWSFIITDAGTIPYPAFWKHKLATAIDLSEHDLEMLNEDYTTYLGRVILNFIRDNHITELDAVCSHGHTIKHEPENSYTLQIGNLEKLAQLLEQTVVCDFRVQDVRFGGQGAPLVPIGDRLLFPNYQYCLNLGGFANISTEKDNRRIAYDICPVNTVLNFYAEKLGMEYDKDGEIAASGSVIPEMLQELENLKFYKKEPPKSLGIEWVNAEVFPVLSKYQDNIPSVLRTFVEHIAIQLSENLADDPSSEVLVTGGGCFNSFLMDQLQKKTKCRITIPSAEIINYKEALIFAFLGVLKLRGEVNVLSSVTGAKKDHSSGVIYRP